MLLTGNRAVDAGFGGVNRFNEQLRLFNEVRVHHQRWGC
jgi:hypothetical protein